MESLKHWFIDGERIVVAFSGGVDSTLLVYLAHRLLGDQMIALTAESPSLPLRDREAVVSFVNRHQIPHQFIRTNEFEDENFRTNPENRCYFCKREIFGRFLEFAKVHRFHFVIDGTNRSDLDGHRPGYRAIQEFDIVRAPYVELGMTRKDIREILRHLGLDAADRPSSACLASRIPYGTRIEEEDLRRVDAAEEILRGMEFSQIRVRHHGGLARIQGIRSEFAGLIERRLEITERLCALGYRYVTIDTRAYDEPPKEGRDGDD